MAAANRNSPVYRAWVNMRVRCNNPHSTRYENWGGRGISYCKEWDVFENFRKDMEASYSKGLTLDRTDNDGNYCKKNCRWITRKEQNRNTRVSKRFTYNGLSLTFGEWAERLGVNRSTLSMRYYVYHWPLGKILTHNL